MNINSLIESLRSIYNWLDLVGFDQFIELIQIALFVVGQGDPNLIPGREATAHTAIYEYSRCIADSEKLAEPKYVEIIPVSYGSNGGNKHVLHILGFCVILPPGSAIN